MNAVAQIPERRSIVTTLATQYGVEPDVFFHTVKSQCMPQEASQEDFAAFLMTCKEYDLNPLLREIYAIKKKGGGYVPVVGIDGWTNIVNSQGAFDGVEFEERVDDKGNLVATTCTIHRKDRAKPISVTEYLAECRQEKSDPWKAMPHRMLRHKAFMQCARYAFSISGIYDPEEAAIIAGSAPAVMRDVTPTEPALPNIEETPQIAARGHAPHPDAAITDAGADARPHTTPASTPSEPDDPGLPEGEDPFDFEIKKQEILNQLSTCTAIAHVDEVREMYIETCEQHMSRAQRDEIDGLYQDAEDRLREASRERVESAGGKGIKQYMDEDRADASLARSIEGMAGDMGEPTLSQDDIDDDIQAPEPPAKADPFAVPAFFSSELPDAVADDDKGYAKWVRTGIAAITDAALASRFINEAWKPTKGYRAGIKVRNPNLYDDLFAETNAKVDLFRGK